MKINREVEVYLHTFLTLVLDGGEWSASRHGSFPQSERASGTHWNGRGIGPSAGMEAVAKRNIRCPWWESHPGHPASSLVTIMTELRRLAF
jgi:hypothetical protein